MVGEGDGRRLLGPRTLPWFGNEQLGGGGGGGFMLVLYIFFFKAEQCSKPMLVDD